MDFNLPEQAHVQTFVPKNTFFTRAVVNTKLKKEFTDTIQKITWEYKLAPDTVGITGTELVEEIQIFHIELKAQIIPKNVLKLIDKSIMYPILYVFTYQNHVAYGITLRNVSEQRYYFSNWNQKLTFRFTGINLERVYEGLIATFIGHTPTTSKDFATIVEQDIEKGRLDREIGALANKIKNERQFNKKVELNKTLQAKKQELTLLTKETV